MNVHQILSGAGRHDAITSEALQFRSRFREFGWGGSDHAARIAPGSNGSIAPLPRLSVRRDDVLLLHHSAGAPRLAELLRLPNPKLLLYHNVTPPDWLWDQAPVAAFRCAIGLEQLPELVQAVDVAAAASAYSAAELRSFGATRTEVIPLLVDTARLGPPTVRHPGRSPVVLFVGRLSPHKRQADVIRVFALYRRYRAPGARLRLVGDPVSTAYVAHLRNLAERLAPGAVTIESGLTEAELGDRYRSTDVFVCLSAHEGFCAPLLEAFYFGVPVIAGRKGAVPETAGDAALLFDDSDPAVVAELLDLAVRDEQLRAVLRSRGKARLQLYSPEAVGDRLRAAVEATQAAAGRR
jgi:glycosyltransferase involved in cell wall biosynthesis